MAELPGSFVRQFLGQAVRVFMTDGPVVDAYFLSFDGRSLWLVVNGEDHFVPLATVTTMRARRGGVPSLAIPN